MKRINYKLDRTNGARELRRLMCDMIDAGIMDISEVDVGQDSVGVYAFQFVKCNIRHRLRCDRGVASYVVIREDSIHISYIGEAQLIVDPPHHARLALFPPYTRPDPQEISFVTNASEEDFKEWLENRRTHDTRN